VSDYLLFLISLASPLKEYGVSLFRLKELRQKTSIRNTTLGTQTIKAFDYYFDTPTTRLCHGSLGLAAYSRTKIAKGTVITDGKTN
jgi:hypothetical protein